MNLKPNVMLGVGFSTFFLLLVLCVLFLCLSLSSVATITESKNCMQRTAVQEQFKTFNLRNKFKAPQ